MRLCKSTQRLAGATRAPARWAIFCLLAIVLTACASSGTEVKRIESVPGVEKSYQALLIFAVTKNSDARNTIEQRLTDELVKEGFAARRVSGESRDLPWEDPKSLGNLIFSSAEAAGSDGVLVMSLERKERETSYIPEQVIYQPEVTPLGPLASTTYMRTVVIPAHTDESLTYVIRSTLYDTGTRAPVWRLYSATVDPGSLRAGARDFSKVLVKALNKTLPKATP